MKIPKMDVCFLLYINIVEFKDAHQVFRQKKFLITTYDNFKDNITFCIVA